MTSTSNHFITHTFSLLSVFHFFSFLSCLFELFYAGRSKVSLDLFLRNLVATFRIDYLFLQQNVEKHLQIISGEKKNFLTKFHFFLFLFC